MIGCFYDVINVLSIFAPNSFCVLLSQKPEENACVGLCFLIKLQPNTRNVIEKETQTPLFFCNLLDIFKNTCFTEHLLTTLTTSLVISKRGYCKNDILNGEF